MAIGPKNLTEIINEAEKPRLAHLEKAIDAQLAIEYAGRRTTTIEVPRELVTRYCLLETLCEKYKAAGWKDVKAKEIYIDQDYGGYNRYQMIFTKGEAE